MTPPSYPARGLALSLVIVVLIQCTVSATPTPSPTVYPRPPTSYDSKVGTAFAPTTPGGACVDSSDYAIWTTKGPNGTGFDTFPVDLQSCSVRCISIAETGQSSEYQCGGLSRPACSPNQYAICVRDCMARQPVLTNAPNFPTMLTPLPYSVPCASCMGNVSYCAYQNCFSSCVFGNTDITCKICNENNCNAQFEACAGLNIDQKLPEPFDFTGVIVGAVSAGAGLLLSVGVFGYRYRMKTRKLREMSVKELERLALSPANIVGLRSSLATEVTDKSSGHGRDKRSSAVQHASHKKQPPVAAVPTQLTPYQQQYERQLRKAAELGDRMPERPTPSTRLSYMVADPTSVGKNGGQPLIMIWSFQGERQDELTVEIGTKLLGLEQADGWWLAQLKDGRIGLVPVAFTAHDLPSKKAYPTKTVPPSARMSRMQSTYKTSPSQRLMEMAATPLIVVYDFDAMRDDEFSAKEGEVVFGLHEQDGWWLVRNESATRIGLIPASYVEPVIASTTLPDLSRSPPAMATATNNKNIQTSFAAPGAPQPAAPPNDSKNKWLNSEPDF